MTDLVKRKLSDSAKPQPEGQSVNKDGLGSHSKVSQSHKRPKKTFASPLKSDASHSTTRKHAPSAETAALEQRLQKLKQAKKCHEDDSITRLKKLVELWKAAARESADALWSKYAAQSSGGFEGFGGDAFPAGGGFGGTSAFANDNWGWASADLDAPWGFDGPTQRDSADAEHAAGSDEDDSDELEEPAKLLARLRRQRKSVFKLERPAEEQADDEYKDADVDEEESVALQEKPWDVGRMLDSFGLDKFQLGWDAEEAGWA